MQLILVTTRSAAIIENQITPSMWHGFANKLTETLPFVLATSTSNVVVQAVLPPITQLLTKIVDTFSFVVSIGQKGFNRFCNRPNPLCASELCIWEQVLENITGTLCEQSIAGTIMLQNIPRISVDDESDKFTGAELRGHWTYYVQYISAMFGHVADYLEMKIAYYVCMKDQCVPLVLAANSMSLEDRHGIVFMIKMIVGNLRHMIVVCAQAHTADDLDTEHIKKLSRNTLLMLKKLREMIGGSYDQKNAGSTPSFNGGFNTVIPTMSGKVNGF